MILSTLEVLTYEHDVPALPIHDSLIVPQEANELARTTLAEAFRAAFGIEAKIA